MKKVCERGEKNGRRCLAKSKVNWMQFAKMFLDDLAEHGFDHNGDTMICGRLNQQNYLCQQSGIATETDWGNTMETTIKEITPAIAMKMLEGNTGNRTVSDKQVQAYAHAMSCGDWKNNGDTICMNGDRLIDGQHRLLAVVKSGVTIQAIVVEGLSWDVFDTKDIGKKRTAGDTLSMRGEKNCRNLAAALGIVDRYMTRRMGKQVLYTNIEIEALLNKYPDIRRSLQVCAETKKLVSKRLLVGCHYLFAKKDELAADQFVEKLISGSGIVEGEPVYMLRERILHNSLSKAKLTYVPLMAMIIKAWNYQRSGTNPRKLKWVERGPTAEAFPVVE